jgi:hypothetical protein
MSLVVCFRKYALRSRGIRLMYAARAAWFAACSSAVQVAPGESSSLNRRPRSGKSGAVRAERAGRARAPAL